MKIIVLNEFNQCVYKIISQKEQIKIEATSDDIETEVHKWADLMVKTAPRMSYFIPLGEEVEIQYYQDNDTTGVPMESFEANRARI